MPTHAELAGKLLNDAAGFFKTLAEQNEPIKKEMTENATVFEQMAVLVAKDPQGQSNGSAHNELAGKLLMDAADFFKTLAEQNEPIKEQMTENAAIFEHIATRVKEDPLGELE